MPSPTERIEAHPWSLRRRALLLTVSVTAVAWLVGGTAMYFVEKMVSDALFDQRLRDIAGALLTFANHEINELQEAGGDIVHVEGAQTLGRRYHYQIWSKDGQLLMVSVDTTRTPFAPRQETGFSTRTIDGAPMRVVNVDSDDGRLQLQVAEPMSARSAAFDPDLVFLAIPLALSLAVLVGVSAALMRRATHALGESARQVTQRSPADLRPLQVSGAPRELAPFIGAVNSLFSRIENALATERRFTSAAAHELRTPLAAIKVQAQVAQRAPSDEERGRALERLVQSIDGAAHMVDQLLNMSRIDGLRALRAQSIHVHLDSIAAHVIDEMRPLAARRGQTIAGELEPAELEGLEFGIAVLLRNLVDNAVRYGRAGGRIRVRTGQDLEGAYTSVEDDGPGIAPDQRERVFDRFYRMPGHAAIEGCGIGLSIVQAVVEMHHARIALDGSDLGGLRATVRFPAVVDLPAPTGTPFPTRDPVLAG